MTPSEAPQTSEVPARVLVDDPQLAIKLKLIAGETGLGRPIRHPRVQKSGLALAGHAYGVVPTRVQVLGETELSYLDAMEPEARSRAARAFFSLGLSCVVLTRTGEPARSLMAGADATHTPLFVSDSRSSRTINALHAFLDDKLAPRTQLHGVLVDVFGVGLLLLGKSGIGKSECAMELVLRGHRLVADDAVRCDWRPPGMVFGAPADLLRHHIEIRGLGVLNIKSMFGVTSVNERKRIDVVVQLVDWDDRVEYDRLGLDDRYFEILGTRIRELTIPVRPGRDMGTIVEIAARNELLRRAGAHAAKEFMHRLESHLVTHQAIEGEVPRSDSPSRPVEPESLVPEPVTQRPSDEAQRLANTGESSAWIPAIRIPRDEDS